MGMVANDFLSRLAPVAATLATRRMTRDVNSIGYHTLAHLMRLWSGLILS